MIMMMIKTVPYWASWCNRML